ncbi:MAG: hypothetical protein A2283_24010 [Lentisphaerae bacterium RIFOXYA12_FULL_48_11]|nr:MAG: hypothetical protein A2283_24010 [Lentisphaerae bacterium RIFOXYA12_FULL_48_11]
MGLLGVIFCIMGALFLFGGIFHGGFQGGSKLGYQHYSRKHAGLIGIICVAAGTMAIYTDRRKK